jgi:phage protein D
LDKLLTGTKPWQPNFSIEVEGSDITEEIRQNLISLNLTDNGAGVKQSDQISFAVASETLVVPAKGVKVRIWMGFGQEMVDKGTYIVDALASGGSDSSHRIVQVTARAFSRTNARGHSALQSQKVRSWSNVTFGDMLKTISNEHQLTFAIPDDLASIHITHVDQLNESDMNLLTRLAEDYGAVSKVTHNHWLISPRDAITTVSGVPLKKAVITREMVSNWSYRENSDNPDTAIPGSGTRVISYYDVTDGGKIKSLTVGSGEPVIHSQYPQASFQDAQEIVRAYSSSSTGNKKKQKTMTLDFMAIPEFMNLTSQCLITTKGFGKKEDKDWRITKLNLNLITQGFNMNIELE